MHAPRVAASGAPARGAVPRATVSAPTGAPSQQGQQPRLHHQQGGAPHPPNLRGLHTASRLSNLFPRDADRIADADATWQAATAPRCAATARPPAAPETAIHDAEAALRQHGARRCEETQRSFVPPQQSFTERPQSAATTAAARGPGVDFQTVKERKEAAQQRSFDDGDPDDCWGSGGAACGYAEPVEDPFRYSYAAGGSIDARSSSFSGSGAEQTGQKEANGFEGHSGAGAATAAAAEDEDTGFYQSPEWEEFKRNWHRHSRAHHHQWYYTPSGGSGSSSGATPAPGPASAVCPMSAEAAARRALEVAQRPTPSGAEQEAQQQEIFSAVVAAAAHAGHEITAFAAALQIEVDHSRGPEQARRSAKKGILMAYHPDKLAGAAAGQRWLGNCVTQVLNSVVTA